MTIFLKLFSYIFNGWICQIYLLNVKEMEQYHKVIYRIYLLNIWVK